MSADAVTGTVARVRVLLFAACRDLMGCSELSLEIPVGASVSHAYALLVEREPRLARFENGLRYARNDQFVSRDEPLADGDELVLIPPVSGGAC